jgi:hypothetical protein
MKVAVTAFASAVWRRTFELYRRMAEKTEAAGAGLCSLCHNAESRRGATGLCSYLSWGDREFESPILLRRVRLSRLDLWLAVVGTMTITT